MPPFRYEIANTRAVNTTPRTLGIGPQIHSSGSVTVTSVATEDEGAWYIVHKGTRALK